MKGSGGEEGRGKGATGGRWGTREQVNREDES